MASYVFNDTRRETSTIFTLASTDFLTLGSAAFWVAENAASPAIQLANSNRIRVAGELYAAGSAIVSSAGGHTLEVIAGGIVSADANWAVSFAFGANRLLNDGYISGGTGINLGGTGNTINNHGTIFARFEAIVLGSGLFSDAITNTGSIVSAFRDAIQANSRGGLTISNSGVIDAANGAAIALLGVAAVTIVNSGTITGQTAISTGVNPDHVINTGTIIGSVRLGAGNDIFDSSRGVTADTVSGDDGDDLLVGGAADDRLSGENDSDRLVGNDGDDVLNGGNGADELDGGSGRDTASYFGVQIGVLADLADPERNTNAASDDDYVSIENLTGSQEDDALYGDAGRNVLRGDFGNDLLDGRGGADVLRGGVGDDLYVVDDVRDRIVEQGDAQGGIDTVSSRITFTLGDSVENLTLTGAAAIDGTGNDLANAMTGNRGANSLDGGLGFDVLVGGEGADVFRFTAAVGSANADIVDDFEIGIDKLALSRTIFTEVNGGSALAANRFVIASSAQDGNDRIIYDPASGGLFYDPDGTGGAGQVLFGAIDTGLALTASDIQLIG